MRPVQNSKGKCVTKKRHLVTSKIMKPANISSFSILPVLTTFKHNFLARSLLSAYQCRRYLHDDVTSKFAEKKEKIVEEDFFKFLFIRLAYMYFLYICTGDSKTGHF